MEASELTGHHVFTRNIQAAANLIAIGAKIRQPMPVTAARSADKPEDVLFWFENTEITCGGETKPAAAWLTLFLCPWSDFKLSLEHPATFLKAAAENRQILVAGAKRAQEQPFRVIQRGNRVAVIGTAVSEANARRLFEQG
jgi:hypothetical protein